MSIVLKILPDIKYKCRKDKSNGKDAKKEQKKIATAGM